MSPVNQRLISVCEILLKASAAHEPETPLNRLTFNMLHFGFHIILSFFS